MIETRQNAKLLSASLTFLNGGGEMGALIRAHDWSNSSLGHPENWPQPLRTAIRLLLNTGHPMYVWWGPDLLCFYNDAYRRSIGPERHPGSLGRPAREVWAEIWDIIGPQIDHVMMGRGATWQENALVPITRNGRLEEVYWTYSYGPIDDEAAPNGIGGVLVVCTETTEQVLSRRRAIEDIERLAQLFQQAPGFVALLRGADHVFELVNPAYIKLAGRSDLIGRPVRSVFPDIEGQGFFELLDNVFASGEAYSTFGAAITLQPSPDVPTRKHLIDFVYQPIKDQNGVVTGIFVQGSDVTERAAAETASRESEARLREIAATDRSEAQFRLLVRGVTDYAIYMLDPDGLVSSWNLGAQRIKGYAPEEIIGQHFSKFYTEEDRASGVPERGLDTARREGRFETEGWRVRKDGTRFHAHAIIDAIPGEDGEVIGFAKITRDMTERRLEQSRLLESERRFRHLVQSVVDYAIFQVDANGVVATWNRGAERINGYSADEIVGRHFGVFHTEEDQAAGVPERMLATAASEGRFEAESWRVRKDGTRFWSTLVHWRHRPDPRRPRRNRRLRNGHPGHHRANGDTTCPARNPGAARPLPADGGGGPAQRRHRP